MVFQISHSIIHYTSMYMYMYTTQYNAQHVNIPPKHTIAAL